MKTTHKSQVDFTVMGYDDLDVVMDLKVEIMNFHPSRPAPACSDHDSPRFSDCGDDMEFDVHKIILIINDREIEIEGAAADAIYEVIEDRLNNKVENIGEMMIKDAYEDAMERRYEERRGA
jgi:hypothetical protein